jgi:outer membrane murein-binding lipoprotein Lpp
MQEGLAGLGHRPPTAEAIKAQQQAHQQALLRHKESLSVAMQELSTLRSVVKALEGTVDQLQRERNTLLQELRAAKQTEVELLDQITNLTGTCERLTETVQQSGVDSAHRVAQVEGLRREQDAQLRGQIERLQAQLLSTQHPINVSRPIPWSKIASLDSHPVHVLREVVTADAKREERALRTLGIDPQTDQGNESAADDPLPKLLMQSSKGPQPQGQSRQDESEDYRAWLVVLRRIYDVLCDRRKLLHVDSDGPVEFLLRSRNEMVSEITQMHGETRRCARLVSELHQRVELISASAKRSDSLHEGGNPANLIEGHVELIAACLSDLDFASCRVKRLCFTDVDRALHGLPIDESGLL